MTLGNRVTPCTAIWLVLGRREPCLRIIYIGHTFINFVLLLVRLFSFLRRLLRQLLSEELLLGPLHKATLNTKTPIRQAFTTVVTDLLVPDASTTLSVEPRNDSSSLRGGVDTYAAVLIVDLREMQHNL